MPHRVRVFAPATASNLGPGFDVLGLALERPGDLVEAEIRNEPGVEIVEVTGADSLNTNPRENVVGIAAAAALELLPAAGRGVRLWLHKQMPLGSGLGSSAASSVGGAVAVNALFGGVLSTDDLVACALRGEAAASGTAHADNVAPSVLGGIVLIRASDPLDLIRLPVPDALRVVLVHPHVQVLTAEARRLVAERRFTIGQAVANLGNVAALVTALHSGDLALLGRSIQDALVEPVRAPLVPAFAEGSKRRSTPVPSVARFPARGRACSPSPAPMSRPRPWPTPWRRSSRRPAWRATVTSGRSTPPARACWPKDSDRYKVLVGDSL